MTNAIMQQSLKSRALDSGDNASAGHRPVRDLTSMRMIAFFTLLRRSTVLVQRRRFDLSEIECRIMINVAEYQPLSLNGLADLLLQDRGQLSRAVKNMVTRGLLSRVRKPGGPEIEIELAADGRKLQRRMVEFSVQRDALLMEGIDEPDIAIIRRVMHTMIERARNIMDDEQRLLGADTQG